MKLDDIRKIMEALENSELKKIIIKQNDNNFELHLEKASTSNSGTVTTDPQVIAPAVSNVATKVEEVTKVAQDDSSSIESPMVGTFYATPAPDQSDFVKVGDLINKDTVVCIIEAMKVMNEVKSGVSGRVTEVLVENGQPVEYGTPLFRIV